MSHLPLGVRIIIIIIIIITTIIIISVSFQNFMSSENCLGPCLCLCVHLCLFLLHVMFPQLSCLLINNQKRHMCLSAASVLWRRWNQKWFTHSVSNLVSEWQGHRWICPGKLKKHENRWHLRVTPSVIVCWSTSQSPLTLFADPVLKKQLLRKISA